MLDKLQEQSEYAYVMGYKSLNGSLHSNPLTHSISSKSLSVIFSGDSNNFHYSPNKTKSGCVDFSFRTDYKYPQNASESISEHLLKKMGEHAPRTP